MDASILELGTHRSDSLRAGYAYPSEGENWAARPPSELFLGRPSCPGLANSPDTSSPRDREAAPQPHSGYHHQQQPWMGSPVSPPGHLLTQVGRLGNDPNLFKVLSQRDWVSAWGWGILGGGRALAESDAGSHVCGNPGSTLPGQQGCPRAEGKGKGRTLRELSVSQRPWTHTQLPRAHPSPLTLSTLAVHAATRSTAQGPDCTSGDDTGAKGLYGSTPTAPHSSSPPALGAHDDAAAIPARHSHYHTVEPRPGHWASPSSAHLTPAGVDGSASVSPTGQKLQAALPLPLQPSSMPSACLPTVMVPVLGFPGLTSAPPSPAA